MFPDKKKDLYWVNAGNHIVIVLMTIVFAIQLTYDPKAQYLNGLVLEHWASPALLGYMWLHMDILHIVSNIIILWIFGHHVCSKVGNAGYFLAYMLMGVAAGIVHCIYDGRAVIGSSGAIMGILGMSVVLSFRRFSPAGPWIILMWFFLNLEAGFIGYSTTAHLGHAGGFCAGIIFATILVLLDIVKRDETGQSLLDLLQPLSVNLHR